MVLPFFKVFFFFALSLWPFSASSELPPKEISLSLPADAQSFSLIRVLLLSKISEVTLKAPEHYVLLDASGRPLMEGSQLPETTVRPTAEGILWGNQLFREPSLIIESEESAIHIKKREYRHALRITKTAQNQLQVVNILPIDDYLRGVLPWEANPKWPMESLKAQAIASRTYALFQMVESQEEAYDVFQDVRSQVYRGKVAEKKITDNAIQATAGLVMTQDRKIFPAYFHSTCGGSTTRADLIWNVKRHPSLEGVACQFCVSSKHYKWTYSMPIAEIEKKLNENGHPVEHMRAIAAENFDRTGRAQTMVIEHAEGRLSVPAQDFRMWMGPMKFKSLLFKGIDSSNGQIHFRGKGWGHGAGMCQYGMKGLGDLGYDFRRILNFYYPNSDIIQYHS